MFKKILIGVLVLAAIFGLVKFFSGSDEAGITVDSGDSRNPTKDHFLDIDGILRITGSSPDGFVLWDDFTVGTTTPVRAALTNASTAPADLMCDGNSLAVYADASGTTFAPSFKFTVGTTTGPTLYSANILASTTVATSSDSIIGKSGAWPFLLAKGSSITLAIGDYSAAIASSTYYGNWSGQVSIHCWSIGQ